MTVLLVIIPIILLEKSKHFKILKNDKYSILVGWYDGSVVVAALKR